MALPKQVIDDLMNDEDFMSLPEDEQDIYLDRIAAKFGTTPKPENILQRAVKSTVSSFTDPRMAMIPGASGYFAAQGNRDEVASDIKNPVGRFATEVLTDPLTWEGAGAAAKGVGKVAKTGSNFFKGLKGAKAVETGTKIQESVRNKVMDKFLGRTKEFEEKLSKLPEAEHDITDIINNIKSRAEYDPAIKQAIENSPIAKKLLFGSETGAGKILNPQGRIASEEVANQSRKILKTKDLQNLRNELGKGFDYSSPEHSWQLGRELGNLRLEQAKPFPKEMGEIAKGYKDTLDNFGAVKQSLGKSRLGKNILKGFGGEGGAETRKAMDYFLEADAKDINQIYKSKEQLETLKDLNPFRKVVKFR